MKNLTQITPDIYRLEVPFLDIYTTVFFIKTPSGTMLFDTATYPEDMDNYIIPAAAELGIGSDELKYVFISHNHRDHAGGLERFAELYPNTSVVSRSRDICTKYTASGSVYPEDGHILLDALQVVTVPGHAPDAMAIFDTRTKTLLTGDSLQLFGIYGSGAWGANIGMPVEHLKALDKLRAMDISAIIASHDYHPCGYTAYGNAEISRYLDECSAALYRIKAAVAENSQLEDAEIAEIYNKTSGLPTVGARIFTAVRKASDMGLM